MALRSPSHKCGSVGGSDEEETQFHCIKLNEFLSVSLTIINSCLDFYFINKWGGIQHHKLAFFPGNTIFFYLCIYLVMESVLSTNHNKQLVGINARLSARRNVSMRYEMQFARAFFRSSTV